MADSVPVMGRKQLELSPEVAATLERLLRRRERVEAELHAAIVAAIIAGEPQAAIARALGVSRQAIQQRAKARDLDA